MSKAELHNSENDRKENTNDGNQIVLDKTRTAILKYSLSIQH